MIDEQLNSFDVDQTFQLSGQDKHLEIFGATDISQLGISEVARQLRYQAALPRETQTSCDAMGAMRDDVAHRNRPSPMIFRLR